ncbi:MAG: hypothetical protein A6F71_10430 [Cycloclasticus sp. symbiont of Poecilosclerida sp. M]|nr:MAG: hypothetical protein A6F71_10430 [Cycloclasticus sp. symbiont of Poecilosclerida sp. M]
MWSLPIQLFVDLLFVRSAQTRLGVAEVVLVVTADNPRFRVLLEEAIQLPEVQRTGKIPYRGVLMTRFAMVCN